MYLITGATGNIGGRVVHQLLERGLRPRVLVRDVDKARARFGDRVDIAVGDLADAASVAAALAGVHGLFLVNTGADLARRDELTAKAARAAGVKHIVKLSSMDVVRIREPGSAGASAAENIPRTGAWHAQGEDAVQASGVAWTFVQPCGFMSNALGWTYPIKTQGVVRSSTGSGKIAMVHPEDIAAVASLALTTRDLHGKALPLTGPQALSYAEMVAKIGAAIGRQLDFQAISDEEARQGMLKTGMPAENVEALVALWRAVREGQVATVTDTIEHVLGRKPIDFDQWARENAGAFR